MTTRDRIRTMRQSLLAPGLPKAPKYYGEKGNGRFLEVLAIHYDFMPTQLETPKVLWLDLKYPAPSDLQVGTAARLHLFPGMGIMTAASRNNTFNSVFQVSDIIGTKVILSPYKGSYWLPTSHSCSPFGWGYDMRKIDVRPSRQNWKYGYGTTTTYLEYHPQYYTSRPAYADI